jgi:hypothetical protein
MHRRTFILLALAATLAATFAAAPNTCRAAISAADKARLSALFPADGKIPGWKKRSAVAFYDKDTLYNYIDGQADAFFVFDFRLCAAADYIRSSGKGTITVDIYDMGRDTDAFGMYASERYGAKEVKIGTQGYIEPDHVNFWKGRYYVKISRTGLAPADRDAMKKFALAVAQKINAPEAKPAILKKLPKGYIPGTEKYVRKNLLGQKFLSNGVLAEYQVGNGKVTIFAAFYPNPTAAREAVAGLRGYQSRSNKVAVVRGLGEEAFRSSDRYLKALLVARKGATVAGAAGESVQNPRVQALVRTALSAS